MFTPEKLFIPIEKLEDELFRKHDVAVSMLRLDAIHPVVSGNKIFKLHYFLQEAKLSLHKKIITFGGAYSNHLAATAFACKQTGLQSVGIVRGEKPAQLSHTLQFCIDTGMQLHFINKNEYKKNNEKHFTDALLYKYGDHVLIPEGGFSIQGAQGAAMICNYFNNKKFTHVCLSVGTATTLSGLMLADNHDINIIGFSALKNMTDIKERLALLQIHSLKKYTVINDYHFGGYAKKSDELLMFMNNFYKTHNIALDFVYTGKMMFGVYDLIRREYFAKGSEILCIHTGGLQGNQSLSKGVLSF